MEHIVNIFVRAVFVDNMVFAYFLGMCSYLAISKKVGTSMSLGIAVMFMLSITVPLNYLVNKYFLVRGALVWLIPAMEMVDLSFLSFIIFIAVIASLSQILEMLIERFSPTLYATLGIFLPLIAVNCAILGGSLFMQERTYHSAAKAASFGMGSGLGWLLAIASIAAIREKLAYSNVPPPLRGLGISFIVTGLLGVTFMCFLGIKIG